VQIFYLPFPGISNNTGEQQEQKLDPAKYVMIWESSPFSTAPIVISNKLDPGLINALKKVLIDPPSRRDYRNFWCGNSSIYTCR
jgi:ABC-type phosphate/phosphonate transport system substrate-binding protein